MKLSFGLHVSYFFQNNFDEAKRVFRTLNDRALGRFRTQTTAIVKRNADLVLYDCRVERKEEGYAFLKLPQFPDDAIFASRSDSDSSEWDRLYPTAKARCALGFNRRGPRAVAVRLED